MFLEDEIILPIGHEKYRKGDKVPCRVAYGDELVRLGRLNEGKIAVVDCDLASSENTHKFREEFPRYFFELGLQEHNATSFAGRLSHSLVTFLSSFGSFILDEPSYQHGINDMNNDSLKVVISHVGLDVGEDGKSHQCKNYLALAVDKRNFKTIVPADAIETCKVIDYIATHPGGFFVFMGRSEVPVIFSSSYEFELGIDHWLREGRDGTIFSYGTLMSTALNVEERLREDGFDFGVVNKSSPLETDIESMERAVKSGFICSIEDHYIGSGIGTLTLSPYVSDRGLNVKVKRYGIREDFGSGKPEHLFRANGLDVESIVNDIRKSRA